jgi:O-antigen/teichoic acid export membrane protein
MVDGQDAVTGQPWAEPRADRATGVAPASADRPIASAARSSAIVFVGNLVARGLGFLFPVVIARSLDRADFAVAYFVISAGFAIGELVLAGYPIALTRYLAAGRAEGGTLVTATLAGLPLLALSLLVGELIAMASGIPAGLLSVVIIGLSIDAYYFATLRGLRRFGLLVGYRILASADKISLVLAATLLGLASLTTVVLIYAGVYLIAIVVVETIARPGTTLLATGVSVSRAHLNQLTRYAGLTLVSGTAYAALLGLDVLFVQLFAPAQVADYGAARALAMPMTLASFAVGIVLMPHVAGSAPAEQRILLWRAAAVTFAFALAGVLGYVVAAPIVVPIVFPATYAGAVSILPPLAAAIGILGIYSIMTQWWLGIGRPAVPALALIGGAAVATGAHLLVTARFGGTGAAASMGIGGVTAIGLLGVPTIRRLRTAHR